MNLFSHSITRVDDDQLTSIIGTAQKWLVFIGPGISMKVAEAISERWQALGIERVKVILDVDPEVARLGYGTMEALIHLEETASRLGTLVNAQPGIRIGIVITDKSTLIYTPTPLLVEAGSKQEFQPNAVFIDSVPLTIIREIGWGENGRAEQTIGVAGVSTKQIEDAQKDLVDNPPLKYDIARKVRVFNARFEFVEFELQGSSFSRKTVPIPADLIGLANDSVTQRLLKSSFKLIDDRGHFSIDPIYALKQFIVNKYLVLLPGYGWVVLRSNKVEFEEAVKVLKKYILRFQKRAETNLQAEMDKNRTALLNALLPAVSKAPPKRWMKYTGPNPTPTMVQELLGQELGYIFGTAEKLLGEIKVSVIFKGVTYELLNDKDFITTAEARLPGLRFFHEEYDAAKAVQGTFW